MRKVPTLDFSKYTEGNQTDRENFSKEFYDGLVEYGFIILKNSNLKDEVLDEAYTEVKSFFKLPLDEKKKYSGIAGGARGYTPFGVEHAKDSVHPDLKEFWHTGRDMDKSSENYKEEYENVWPEELGDFKDKVTDLYNGLDSVAHLMLEALTGPLNVDKDYFRNLAGEGNSLLRAIYYPPVKDLNTSSVRAGAHEDINLITILVGATSSGLQLMDRDGNWLDVESEEGDLVVDSGDMLSRITNGIIPATTHRVINPPNTSSERFSIPFFVHPNSNSILKCIDSCRGEGEKFEPIKADDFLYQRLVEIGLIKE